MAFIYVDSAAGGTPDGLTWNTAWLTLEAAYADGNLVAGSTIYVDDGHSHSVADTVDLFFSLAGSAHDSSDGISVVCVDKTTATALDNNANGADAAVSSGASEAVSSAGVNYIAAGRDGTSRYIGMNFSGMFQFNTGGYSEADFTDCLFDHLYNSVSERITVNVYGSRVRMKDCTFGFANAGGAIEVNGGSKLEIDNLKFQAGTTLRDDCIRNADNFGPEVIVKNSDLSLSLATSGAVWRANNATAQSQGPAASVKITNCKLPTSFSWIRTRNAYDNYLFEAYNCWTDDSIHHLAILSYLCDVTSDTTNVLAGTYDGTSEYSLLVESSSACNKLRPFKFKVATVYADANATFKLNMIHEAVGAGTSGDLTDAEISMEVVYPDATYGTLGKRKSSRPADINLAGADGTDYPNNTESWTETLTGEVKQDMSVTLADSQAGVHEVWVEVHAPSIDVYIDPFVVVT